MELRSSIRKRLLSAFLAIALLCAVTSGLGILNITVMAGQAGALYLKATVPIENLYVIMDSYQQIRVAVRDALSAETVEETGKQTELITHYTSTVNSLAREFGQTLSDEKQKALFADFIKSFNAYWKGLQYINGLMTLDMKQDAVKYLHGDMKAAAESLDSALSAVIADMVARAKLRYAAIEAQRSRQTLVSVTLAAVAILVASILGFVIAGSISIPLKEAMALSVTVAAGDLTGGIRTRKRREDELGMLMNSLETMKGGLSSTVGEIRDSLDSLRESGRELAAAMKKTSSDVSMITSAIDEVKGQVVSESASVTETSAVVSEIMEGIEQLNGDIERQAASVVQSSASIEQMVANVASVMKNIGTLSNSFGELQTASDDGREKLNETNKLANDIQLQSEKLFEANDIIRNISDQTNLLAMNAAIEAAHAGEAGKGFAVVADEIGKLAEQSEQQSMEINRDITAIKKTIDKVVLSSESTEEAFSIILSLIGGMGSLEEEIRRAMVEQGEGSNQILAALERIKDVTERVKDGSEKMKDGNRTIGEEMRNLLDMSERVRTGMDEIAEGTRAIDSSADSVSEMSSKNNGLVDAVAAQVDRFRLDRSGDESPSAGRVSTES
jgi:methyl-accepting chemotaxis protein